MAYSHLRGLFEGAVDFFFDRFKPKALLGGYGDGAKSYLLCAHCHNPHAPKFAAIEPLPQPISPQFLRKHETTEEVHEP